MGKARVLDNKRLSLSLCNSVIGNCCNAEVMERKFNSLCIERNTVSFKYSLIFDMELYRIYQGYIGRYQ